MILVIAISVLVIGATALPKHGPPSEEILTMEEQPEVPIIPPVVTPGDRIDMPFGGGGGGGHLPGLPHIPGLGSFFGQRLPFEQISGPYVSSSIGPVFRSGPFGGLAIPFSPGPLGGIMGIPLAMMAMG